MGSGGRCSLIFLWHGLTWPTESRCEESTSRSLADLGRGRGGGGGMGAGQLCQLEQGRGLHINKWSPVLLSGREGLFRVGKLPEHGALPPCSMNETKVRKLTEHVVVIMAKVCERSYPAVAEAMEQMVQRAENGRAQAKRLGRLANMTVGDARRVCCDA